MAIPAMEVPAPPGVVLAVPKSAISVHDEPFHNSVIVFDPGSPPKKITLVFVPKPLQPPCALAVLISAISVHDVPSPVSYTHLTLPTIYSV